MKREMLPISKCYKRKLSLLALFLFFTLLAQAGNPLRVSGQVIDEAYGEPLIGVYVQIKETSAGTVTDVDGYFSLTLPDSSRNYTLQIKYVGYRQEEYTITPANAAKPIKITLREDVDVLEEVIVMGCGTSRRMSTTGSVSRVRSSKLSKSASALSGRVSGVSVKGSASKASTEAGLLTAGEVHDFSKWILWEDIAEGDLGMHSYVWKMKPLQRYVAQLVDNKDMPVIDAKVRLLTVGGEIVWEARTDNTGKAELWANIYTTTGWQSPYNITFEYEGNKVEIKNAVQFPEAVNSAKINATCNQKKETDILFIVDATGSMADEINYLQAELYDVIDRVKSENKNLKLRTGCVFYRDHGDEYLTKKSDLDEDIDNTISFISKQRASGGGDYPEAVDYALKTALDSIDWNEEALARIAFLILDAPPHEDAESVARVQEYVRQAAERGIRLIPVSCSGVDKSTEYLLRCMALATNGTYVFLTDDSGIGHAHIKPTTDEYKVEKLNDIFIRLIIQYTETPDCTVANWEKEMQEPKEIENYLPAPYKSEMTKENKKITVADVMTVYPNPCNGILNVEMKVESKDVYLADISGKLLQRFNPSTGETFTIQMHDYSSGVYFIRAFYKDKWLTFKIILKQ